MYNLLIKYAPDAWEDPDGAEMEVARFYGGRLEPNGDKISGSMPDTLTPERLKQLEGIPTLLMYEVGTPGGHAEVVRYGRLALIERFNKVIGFTFEPDPEHGYLDRGQVMKFKDALALGTGSHTHWTVGSGNIPPRLIKLGKPRPPVQSRTALEADLAKAQSGADTALEALINAKLAQLDAAPPAEDRSQTAPESITLVEPLRVIAVVVGLETYHTRTGVPPVAYAEADAKAFIETLQNVYGAKLETVHLVSGEATQSAIRQDTVYAIRNLGPDDLFVFYYAGHGFHGGDGNRITAADTSVYRLQEETLSIRDLLVDPLRQSQCRRALAFIDACAVNLPKTGRDVIANLDPHELDQFLNSADFSAVFLSCKPGQKSYPSAVLQHGVWTYHVLKALRGEAPTAVGPGGWVTDATLKDYLSTAVPAYIRHETNIRETQNPEASIRAEHTFGICRVANRGPTAPTLTALGLNLGPARLENHSSTRLRQLQGWKATYRTPTIANKTTRQFVDGVATPDVEAERQALYDKTKQAFSLSHRGITTESEGASADLHTDAFRYSVQVEPDAENLDLAAFDRRLEIRRHDARSLAGIDEVFGTRFDEVVAEFDIGEVTYSQIVDAVEHLEKTLGGSHRDERREERATYSPPEGGDLVIDRRAGEIRLSLDRAKPSELLQKAGTLLAALGAAAPTPADEPDGLLLS